MVPGIPVWRRYRRSIQGYRRGMREDDEFDLVDVLTAAHRTVESLLADVETTSDRRLRQRALVAALAALQRHSTIEERFLYPATRKHLPAGDVLAAHEEREHAEADEKMHRLARLDDTDPEYEPLVSSLFTDIRVHVNEEETELFPRLRAACDPETLRRLGSDAAGT
jgi:hemerythrin superfamily protein